MLTYADVCYAAQAYEKEHEYIIAKVQSYKPPSSSDGKKFDFNVFG
jgi:hypothetical protein